MPDVNPTLTPPPLIHWRSRPTGAHSLERRTNPLRRAMEVRLPIRGSCFRRRAEASPNTELRGKPPDDCLHEAFTFHVCRCRSAVTHRCEERKMVNSGARPRTYSMTWYRFVDSVDCQQPQLRVVVPARRRLRVLSLKDPYR